MGREMSCTPRGGRSRRLRRAAVGRSAAESGRAPAKPDDSSIELFGGCERRERPPNVLISCLRENQIRRRPDYFNNTVQVNRASPVLAGQLHHLLGGYISRSLGGLLIAVR
jgi:hypothetical protein